MKIKDIKDLKIRALAEQRRAEAPMKGPFEEELENAFLWGETKEGRGFWIDVNDEYIDITKHVLYPHDIKLPKGTKPFKKIASMNEVRYRTKDVTEKYEMIAVLSRLGFGISNNIGYEILSLGDDRRTIITGDLLRDETSKSIFLKLAKAYKIPLEVKLNEEHTAIVSEDMVKVGCQEFTHKAIKELNKAINKISK